jgi:hypothetical protein
VFLPFSEQTSVNFRIFLLELGWSLTPSELHYYVAFSNLLTTCERSAPDLTSHRQTFHRRLCCSTSGIARCRFDCRGEILSVCLSVNLSVRSSSASFAASWARPLPVYRLFTSLGYKEKRNERASNNINYALRSPCIDESVGLNFINQCFSDS